MFVCHAAYSAYFTMQINVTVTAYFCCVYLVCGRLNFFSSGFHLYVLLSSYLIVYLDLYVLGDDSSISMRPNIYVRTKDEIDTAKHE